jgi:DNA-binding NtrC family response regulator
MPHALIVDDDPGFTPALGEFVKNFGFSVRTVPGLRAARAQCERAIPDLVLIDLILPDGSGLDLVRDLSATKTKVIVITGHPTVERAVASLRSHVTDFLIKPLDMGRLRTCLGAVASSRPSETPHSPRSAEGPDWAPFGYLVGRSAPMRKLYRMVEKAAPTDVNVLLQGESGTGKELVAQAIHDLSPRRDEPFLVINCGAVPDNLIGSELFGHERGSFTGATRQHQGCFERAAGGTLLLDEISEMPLELQVHLLRALEAGTVRRLGGDREIKLNVRVIAATNRTLEAAVSEGRFREDLFFRLMVFPITLPPLRERRDDIPLLANHFLALLNDQKNAQKCFTTDALEHLAEHDWRGNVHPGRQYRGHRTLGVVRASGGQRLRSPQSHRGDLHRRCGAPPHPRNARALPRRQTSHGRDARHQPQDPLQPPQTVRVAL